jgi:uncharacterized membrane protein
MPVVRLLVVILGLSLWASSLSSADTATTAQATLDQAALHILDDSCVKCHGVAKSRGRLRLDTRQTALAGGKSGPALIPGDAGHSLLMRAVRYDDPDLQMPPDAPLPAPAVTTLASWIASGASWNVPGQSSAEVTTSTVPSGTPTPASAPHPAPRRAPLIGRIHPLVVHFPICCLLLAVLAEFLVITLGPKWDPVVRFLVIIGTLAAVVAVVTGTWFAPEGTLFHHQDLLLTRHEFVGWLTMILGMISSVLLLSGSRPRLRLLFRATLLVTAVFAGLTGHLGGTMVYGEHFLF